MDISFKLEVFEGPLDLLLHLIDKNKVNIHDIPIALITEQYLDYVNHMETKDLNVMSEFLVMAATLLNIKSKMLLPKDEKLGKEEEDPRQELVERLLEYKMYKYISLELKDRELDAGRAFYKNPSIPEEIKNYEEKVDVSLLLSDLTLAKLHRIFETVIKRQVDKIDPIRSKFGRIEKEEGNLSDKMEEIQKYGRLHKTFSFYQLLMGQRDKIEIIVTFLGILELMKTGEIHIQQDNLFDDIMITYKEEVVV
ncbi:segregation/condensation protein A [Anaerocolumna sp. AGMB13020]|uniref:segregation and condensation protein A n=1 Tax=Anaerocolumna sp. AGMB13020 TaxID=3081750 RepID=UPI002952EA9B|nr:segregation/condensation protein A [Anaerocolumna sp. AGMB13020]WOO37151.1 segregation/condensation protein A [Anaerocolumna sp. AGMB13020]